MTKEREINELTEDRATAAKAIADLRAERDAIQMSWLDALTALAKINGIVGGPEESEFPYLIDRVTRQRVAAVALREACEKLVGLRVGASSAVIASAIDDGVAAIAKATKAGL
jgi:hypothetical protein